MAYTAPTPANGDYVSDTILMANQTYGFQLISNVASGVNSTTSKTYYTLTCTNSTVKADQDYLVLHAVLANGVQYWVMSSQNSEQTGE